MREASNDELLKRINDLLSDLEATEIRLEKYKRALNHIAMLGHGELAYTSEFTEQVMQIAHKALTGRDRGL